MRKRFLVIALLGIGLFQALTGFAESVSLVVKSEFILVRNLPDVPFVHAPTIAETSGGLVVAWFGGTGENNPDTKIYLSRLDKDQKNWTIPVAVAQSRDEKGPLACWNPVLFWQKSGPLFLFYKSGRDPESWKGEFRVSFDEGKTWGPAGYLPAGILGPAKNKPLELEDGTILFPSSLQTSDSWKIFIERIRPKNISDLLSKDNWSVTGPLNRRSMSVIQPALLNFGGGRMLLLSRNKQPNPFLPQTIMGARSADNGLSWSKLRPAGLANPNSAIDAAVLRDGRCVLVCNPSRFVRTPLVVEISPDQGRTWVRWLKLEKGFGEYSYPSVIQAGNGMIHIVYSWQRRKIKHVVIDPNPKSD